MKTETNENNINTAQFRMRKRFGLEGTLKDYLFHYISFLKPGVSSSFLPKKMGNFF